VNPDALDTTYPKCRERVVLLQVSELSFHGCSASVESLEYFSRCLPMRVSRAATFPETLLSPWASTSLSLLAPIVAGEP
jgi:hypothetical protein